VDISSVYVANYCVFCALIAERSSITDLSTVQRLVKRLRRTCMYLAQHIGWQWRISSSYHIYASCFFRHDVGQALKNMFVTVLSLSQQDSDNTDIFLN